MGRIGAYIPKLVGERGVRKGFYTENNFLGKTNEILGEKEIQMFVMLVYIGRRGLSISFKAIKLP